MESDVRRVTAVATGMLGSERVLAGTDRGEHGDRIAVGADGGRPRRLVGAEEGIGPLLLAQRRRDGGLAPRPQPRDLLRPPGPDIGRASWWGRVLHSVEITVVA